MKQAWLAFALLLTTSAGLLTHCAALNDSAPAPTQHNQCPTLDERLQTSTDLLTAGKLQHLSALIADDLDVPSQRAVVALILALAKALPPGVATQLPEMANDSRVQILLPLLLAILGDLPGDHQAQPPIPPKIAEMTAFSAMARTCLTQQTWQLLTDIFQDPRTPGLLNRLLVDVLNGAPQLQNVLKQNGVQGRAGLLALLHNVLTAVAATDFDPEPLVQTVAGLGTPQQPGTLDALAEVLKLVLLNPDGHAQKAHVQAAGALSACMLARDPEQRVAGVLYDVLLAQPLTPTALPEPTTQSTQAGELQTLLPVLGALTQELAGNEAARDALGEVLGLVLRPEIGVAALPELLDLLHTDALQGILALLHDLLTHPCPAPP